MGKYFGIKFHFFLLMAEETQTQKRRRQKQTVEEQRMLKKQYRDLISNTEADRQALISGATSKLIEKLKEGSTLFKNGLVC